ncbi:MAG TPA: ferrous iron transport protein B [Firmicutes bacterium]|nr:ferrous iron transport protein B [Bacillota bacterium]
MNYLLIGNPNVGKTTFFNILTGANAHVGNYSGITVDKLEGTIKKTGHNLIDLPGTYSVTPSSEDEGVVTYALLKERFNGILNIVDATHLKRNLQLTVQLLETGTNVLIAMNMMDALQKQGLTLNKQKLEELLGVKVNLISALKNEGIDDVVADLQDITTSKPLKLYYGLELETAISKLMSKLNDIETPLDKRWIAIQILEGNPGILQHLPLVNPSEILPIVSETEKQIIDKKIALSLKGAIFNKRRELIHKIYNECVTTSNTGTAFKENKPTLSPVDHYLTHPVWGLVIFFTIMFVIYMITFDWLGNPISDGFDLVLTSWLIPTIESLLAAINIIPGSFLYGALIEGLAAGVGGVIIFLPQILILFFCLSLMEAIGYMARVAIVMDYIFSKVGLNGKAIVPLVTGFGCNVPAIMATRTIPDKMERIKTMMIIPFMSCSARLPIYVLFVGLFFKEHQAVVIMGLYLLGIIVALLSAKLLTVSLFKKTEAHFVLEIPPYRVPQLKNLMHQTLSRGSDFLHTAGKFIVIGSILLWILNAMGPTGLHVNNNESYLAIVGGWIAPLFAPLGFGTWQAGSSLVVGFLAKELVASSSLIIVGGEAGIVSLFTPIQAFSFVVFSLLYIPCLSTVGVMYQETKSARTTTFMVAFGLIVAYVVTFIIYQVLLIMM